MEAQHDQPTYRALWFSLLVGPIMWSVHFLAVYLLVEVACMAGALRTEVFGTGLVVLLLLVMSGVALAVVVYGIYLSYRSYRRAGGHSLFSRDPLSGSPARFMAASGLALNLVFALLIVLMAIPALFLNPCLR